MSGAIAVFQALTSLHPGAGGAAGAIDMPVQREKHTLWPMMQSSGVKGVFREAAQSAPGVDGADVDAVFGPPVNRGDDHAGALLMTDATLLLFPVRSLKGVYALVTCPLALQRYAEARKLAGLPAIDLPHDQRPGWDPTEAWCNSDDLLFFGPDEGREAVIGDVAVRYANNTGWNALAPYIASLASEEAGRIIVVSDDVFAYFVRFHTEVIPRNRLKEETKTVERGALWNEEYLPPQTVLYSVLLSDRVYADWPGDVWCKANEWFEGQVLQFGGNATIGKGLCRVALLTPEGGANHD